MGLIVAKSLRRLRGGSLPERRLLDFSTRDPTTCPFVHALIQRLATEGYSRL